MTPSRIRYFKASDLASKGDLPSVVIRLMQAVNDIADNTEFYLAFVEQSVGSCYEFNQVHLFRQPDSVAEDAALAAASRR